VRSGRKTFWFSGVISVTTVAAGASVLVTTLNAAALALRPFTIVRTRGWWSMFSDTNVASEDQVAMIGRIVVSDQAVAIGVTAVPTPITDSGSGWFSYDGAAQRMNVGSEVGIQGNFAPERYVIDSKSMRKVEEGQDVIKVVEASAASEGLILTSFSRVLVKLH